MGFGLELGCSAHLHLAETSCVVCVLRKFPRTKCYNDSAVFIEFVKEMGKGGATLLDRRVNGFLGKR